MASPSEFLTFYRRAATLPAFRTRLAARPAAIRPFSSSVTRFGNGEHATDKKDKLDIQSEQSSKGREAKSQGEGGQATTQSDSRGSTAQAKKDHPEAPDVVIGMQDERGGKGH